MTVTPCVVLDCILFRLFRLSIISLAPIAIIWWLTLASGDQEDQHGTVRCPKHLLGLIRSTPCKNTVGLLTRYGRNVVVFDESF
jgi:hypothetical protein